jgi:hypothetical protein
MFEMPLSREHEGNVVLCGRLDDFAVSHRASWFDDCGDTGEGESIRSVAKWEERV